MLLGNISYQIAPFNQIRTCCLGKTSRKMQLNLGSLQIKTTPKGMLSKNVTLRCFTYFHIFDAVRFIDNLVDQAQDSPWRCVARTEDER